ncbi:MAG: ice-binding family protein, partial [Pseudomonadota bacterium]
TAPTVTLTDPADLATDVAINRNITATFSEAMDPLTITTATFTLTQGGATPVPGAVTYVGTTATFNPTSNLAVSTVYTATITTGAKDLADNALAADKVWSFTTRATTAAGPAPVNLGTAGDFVILAKSGISTVPDSEITGDIGVSPIDRTALTGFGETMDISNEFSTSAQVVAPFKLYAADYAVPTPAKMTTAVSDMETAYTDAAGRPTPDFIELGAGEIGGLTLVPGLYKWGTSVSILNDVTLDGGPNDVWIFQIAGDITMAAAKSVILSGGALPKNIFWQTFGFVALGTTAHFEGVILSYTEITVNTGASVNGRLLSQTAVTLDQNAVTQPAP